MGKTEIIKELAKRTGLSVQESTHAFHGLLEILTDALERGEKVSMCGFGTLKPARRAKRPGRDIRAGKTIEIPARVVVKFSAYGELKRRVNKDGVGC
nr:MAG TPA: DNA binding protein [Podoviridae sp. ctgx11]